jgi:hypothetical protein
VSETSGAGETIEWVALAASEDPSRENILRRVRVEADGQGGLVAVATDGSRLHAEILQEQCWTEQEWVGTWRVEKLEYGEVLLVEEKAPTFPNWHMVLEECAKMPAPRFVDLSGLVPAGPEQAGRNAAEAVLRMGVALNLRFLEDALSRSGMSVGIFSESGGPVAIGGLEMKEGPGGILLGGGDKPPMRFGRLAVVMPFIRGTR